jgi:hypothetical protein
LNKDENELGVELLRIKGAINQKRHTEEDVKTYRSCLEKGGDLALIAAGYALAESLAAVKQTAVEAFRKRLAEIRTGGVLPNAWSQAAMLEGLVFTDRVTLLSISGDLMIYMNRLPVSSSEISNIPNACRVLGRMADLNVKKAREMLDKIEGK